MGARRIEFDKFGNMHGRIPKACVSECSSQGAVDDAVAYWQRHLPFNVPRELAIQWLREFGAWELSELQAEDDTTIARRVLWLACCEIKESGNWFGLVH